MPEERATQPQLTTTRHGLTPLRAFAVVATMLAIAGTALYVTSRAESNTEVAPRDPPFSTATSEESAVTPEALFQELSEKLLTATQAGDISSVREVTAPGSPARRRAIAAIKQLERDKILDASRFETIAMTKVVASEEKISLLETRIVAPCFLNPSGRDVTKRHMLIEQTVRWTLVPAEAAPTAWTIAKGQLISDKVVGSPEERCG